MTKPIVRVHTELPRPNTHLRLPTGSSAVCWCGAVFDNGNVDIAVEYRGLCGRCAIARGMRLGQGRGLGVGV